MLSAFELLHDPNGSQGMLHYGWFVIVCSRPVPLDKSVIKLVSSINHNFLGVCVCNMPVLTFLFFCLVSILSWKNNRDVMHRVFCHIKPRQRADIFVGLNKKKTESKTSIAFQHLHLFVRNDGISTRELPCKQPDSNQLQVFQAPKFSWSLTTYPLCVSTSNLTSAYNAERPLLRIPKQAPLKTQCLFQFD